MIELGVSACGVDEFTRAVHPAVGCYLRRRLSSRRGPASLAGKPSLCGLLSPDHNVQQLLPRLLVFSPVRLPGVLEKFVLYKQSVAWLGGRVVMVLEL